MMLHKRPEDGFEYFAYILIFVDDIICVQHNPGDELVRLDKYFTMKDGSIQEPTFYLGAKLKKTVLPNSVIAWGMSSSKYVNAAVHNVREYLAISAGVQTLKKRATVPFPVDYHPEMDATLELSPVMANYYQTQTGVLRWGVELGRIDIVTKLSVFASRLCLPREGHLDTVFHLFAHLANNHNVRVVFDRTYPIIDDDSFVTADWKAMYGDIKEALPPDAPVPLGKDVDLHLYVNSNHAGEKFTKSSRTSFVIYLNMAPVVWFSKQQSKVESNVFGAEFFAIKNGIETVSGLRYKLQMMGVPLIGP
jgi:hypothetical protein